jgi:thioredoxin reductase (NADPH)
MAKIKVYGAPWCPDCKRSKQFLAEQRVPYDWIDIDKEPSAADVVREKNNGKQIIPTIVFEDGSFLAEPPNDELARKLGLSLKAERSFYTLIIIGGGPAGLTASIYAAREGIDTLVIEKSGLGGQAGVTERIDNYPGFPEGIGGAELADRIIQQARRYDVALLSAVAVQSLSREDDRVTVRTEGGDEYAAHAVIIATGSTYRRLNVPGEDDFIGAGIHFCATCDGPFYKGSEELMVIGGGNSGVEEGLFLTQFTKRVTLLEYNPALKASSLLQEKARSNEKIDIFTNTQVSEFKGNGRLRAVVATDVQTGETREFTPAGVFVFVGLTPNTGFLEGAVDLDAAGFIKTDATLQTSLPGVYAAGRRPAGQHQAARERDRRGRDGPPDGAAAPPIAGRRSGEGGGVLALRRKQGRCYNRAVS